MDNVINQLDRIERRVMSGLKDFQRATVERIDHLYRSGQMRVLVSDEVGLGKTLVARGVIAKLAQMQKEKKVNLVRVVYICSNAAIADQNLEKLMISNHIRREAVSTSRLSMQHLNIFMQENDPELHNQYVQLIPLTPETSFRMTNSCGNVDERALMYAILKRLDQISGYTKELEVAMMDQASASWPWFRDVNEQKVAACNRQSKEEYISQMRSCLTEELKKPRKEGATYLEQLKALLDAIRANNNKRVRDNGIIGKLRTVFAQISLARLEPDLVIMDEFQRFSYLLKADEKSPIGELKTRFFDSDSVRMLLLSATPYKMYSTLEEIDETQIDEHYSEFMEVMHFLNGSEKEDEKFQTVWKQYSVELKELSQGSATILQARQAAEDSLYSHICRTERISAAESADMIDTHAVKEPLRVNSQDITSYLQAQQLLDDIGLPYHVPVDYVKSCPYLMSFMQNYKLKRDIEKYFTANPEQTRKLNRKSLWLKKQDFLHYRPIAPGNARLAEVMRYAFADNAEKLLWVPPSRPYYAPAGVFGKAKHFSKMLIFSSWEMVPRMLSCMLSYEAERRTIGVLANRNPERDAKYFHGKGKRFPPARLNFSFSGGEAKSMTLFCLMYPSRFLADCYDPLDCMSRKLSLKEIQEEIKEKILKKLTDGCREFKKVTSGPEDVKWYYMAPLFMDGDDYVTAWLRHEKELSPFKDDNEQKKQTKSFLLNLQELKRLYHGSGEMGRVPHDLLDVLATMAIASPAVCAYRTYCRYTAFNSSQLYMPSQLAEAFMSYMNIPDSTAVIQLCYAGSGDPYWLNLLNYCKSGNLQAVFDEYAHLLTNGFEHNELPPERLQRAIIEAMSIRATPYEVDTCDNFKNHVQGNPDKKMNIRTYFAVSFTKGEGESHTDRKKLVRNAFNSPFRPFVLASTSIGQEGLDFHNYCRRIVHWNLPSNPIDLEQREGRINRFECLAIRQNVADRYGNIPFNNDIWDEMFDEAAKQEKAAGSSDLIPYWGLRETDNMVRIERIVPMYPFSKDELSYERLIKILSLYRLALGQPRQEELLEYIFKNVSHPEELQNLFINLSPFYKGKK